MKPCRVTTYFKERFSARIFLIFSILIIIVSLSFTIFFFRYQSRSLMEQTLSKGELLASLLAHTARLGVFTENADQLKAPIQGVMENREVLSAAVYTADGRLLALQNRSGGNLPAKGANWDPKLQTMLNNATPTAHFSDDGAFVFWRRLALELQVSEEDAVYYNALPAGENEQVIGFAAVVLDGSLLQKSLHAVLLHSILIGFGFLIVGSVAAYVIAGRITKPLKQLIEGVNALGMGKDYKKINVKSGDEIGSLAAAFNEMVESLKKRDAEKNDLEEQLRHSQKMEAIGTLAGGVAHDFNNILMVITAYDTLLKLGLDEGSKLWSYADQINNAAEKAASLTSRLLAFSRKQIITPRPTQLNQIIKSVEKILALLITEDIELKLHLDPADPTVMADSGQLDHVLINLVSNARDAMAHGGKLTIKTSVVARDQEKSYAAVTVSDTGIGMTDEIKARIFDPFFTTKEVGKGTGLGLSMAYGIIQQHDGVIEVDTETGKGTSVAIYLPLVKQAADERRANTTPLLQGKSETILVAEDDTAVMGVLKAILEGNGYNVIEASTGEDAVGKFTQHRHDIKLALLDVIMPGKNGKQVHEEIIEISPAMKTIFLSGYTNDVIDGKGILDKEVRLISKPIQADQLLQQLREALDG